jgi:hypothetical protein
MEGFGGSSKIYKKKIKSYQNWVMGKINGGCYGVEVCEYE